MNKSLKILIVLVLLAGVFTNDKICEHLGFGQNLYHQFALRAEATSDFITSADGFEASQLINDEVYRWDEEIADWVTVNEGEDSFTHNTTNYGNGQDTLLEPIEIDWEQLINIDYQLKYFSQVDMEIYAPIFPDNIKVLDGKEVIIKGFVLPIDQELEILALSANPYASCFFCGQASPASVISMYLKDEKKRYKMDDFKKFSGYLHLNADDPEQFYYILKEAEELKD